MVANCWTARSWIKGCSLVLLLLVLPFTLISIYYSFRILIVEPPSEWGPKLNMSRVTITGRHCHPPHCRNVAHYGAIGDGIADDTAALVKALTDGRADDPIRTVL